MTSRSRWLWVLAVALSLALGLAAGCERGGNSLTAPKGLVRCQNCDDVAGWITRVAVAYMNRVLDQNLYAAINNGGYYYGDDEADQGSADDDASRDDSSGGDYSGTNVQENGVDEADMVKTDGDRLFVATGGFLLLFDPRPATEIHELSRIAIEGQVRDLFLYGDVAMVFSTLGSWELPDDVWPDRPRDQMYWNILKVTLIDVSDSSAPALLREVYAEGDYVSSRRVDASARVIIRSAPYVPAGIEWWVDPWAAGCVAEQTGEIDEDCLRAAYEALRERNREIMENTPWEQWLPQYFEIRHTADGTETSSGALSQCPDFFHSADPFGNAILTVMTVVLDDPMTHQADVGIVGDAQVAYASRQSLYLTGAQSTYDFWGWEPARETDGGGDGETSDIYKFDIGTSPTQAIYVGSGAVSGWVLNQYAMSEKDGVLRVATTVGQWSGAPSNNVTTLREEAGALVKVGELTGIQPGESLYAARFLGDKGYLVTFQRVDPLLTVDLSDPANPALAGQLDMPGYSTYLHPMDDSHLLAVGLQGDDTGSVWGVKLSLFDVSDFANPREVATEAIGGYDASSAAQYDPHAFLYYAKFDLLALPIMQWGGYYGDDDVTPGDDDVTDDDVVPDDDVADDDQTVPAGKGQGEPGGGGTIPSSDDDTGGDKPFSGVYVYKVTVDGGFALRGKVAHTDMTPEPGDDSWYGGMPSPLRSTVIDTYLYTISDVGLVVTDLTTMTDVARISLPWKYPWGGEDGGGGTVPADAR